MDFRRLLPEIRWQSRLSPVFGTGSPDWFFDPVKGTSGRWQAQACPTNAVLPHGNGQTLIEELVGAQGQEFGELRTGRHLLE